MSDEPLPSRSEPKKRKKEKTTSDAEILRVLQGLEDSDNDQDVSDLSSDDESCSAGEETVLVYDFSEDDEGDLTIPEEVHASDVPTEGLECPPSENPRASPRGSGSTTPPVPLAGCFDSTELPLRNSPSKTPTVPLAGGSGSTALPHRNSGSKAPPIRNSSNRSQDPPQNIPQMCFVGKEELEVAPIDRTPFGFFRLFFTDEFFVYLANETNAYAEYVLLATSIGPRSRICEWKKVTVDELKTFLGIVFYQGIIQARRYHDYWKRHYLFKLPVSKFMSRDRFLLIMRCMHFQSQREELEPTFKILPLVNYFNEKMDSIFGAPKNLSIDESMVGWRGRLSWRQHIRNKRHKYAMKLYVMADPNGIVLKVHVFGGSKDQHVAGQNHAGKVIEKLTEGKLGMDHSLFMDNFCNSVPLSEKRPPEAVSSELKKGNIFAQYSSNNICVSNWRDKREVLAISSEFGHKPVKVKNKRGQEREKPRFMKGYDRQDQMLSYYSPAHKTLRWYKKLGIHIFHLMLNNAYLLFKNYGTGNEKLDLHDFQLEICAALLPEPPPPPTIVPPSFHVHLPTFLPSAKGSNRTMRKRCKKCMEDKNIRKDSMYGCPSCQGFPGFCLEPCFRSYHQYK